MKSELLTYSILLLITIIPPVIVHLVYKDKDRTTVSLMVTGFFFIPGYIHLFYVTGETLYLKYLKKRSHGQFE